MSFSRALGLGLLVACGGGSKAPSDSGKPADAPIDAVNGTEAPPACMPAVPASTVIAVGSADTPANVNNLVLTSSGEVAVFFYDNANGESARTWENGEWTTHTMYTGTNGGFGGNLATEVAGRPAYFSTVSDQTSDSNKLRDWLQLSTGSFATGARVDDSLTTPSEATHARYSTTSSVLAVAADDEEQTVYSHELNSAGTWTTQQVSFTSLANETRAAGIGTLTDGTAVIAVATVMPAGDQGSGLELYRRTGVAWSPYKSFATGNISTAFVELPPDGGSGTSGVAVYEDPTTFHPRGLFFDTTSGTPGNAADLMTSSIGSYFYSQIVYDSTGTGGKILLISMDSVPLAWIVPFQGTSFSPAEELRPDLVFDAQPFLVYHPCGGFMILHVTRTSAAAAGSEPAVLEPLSTFAPGL
jgi:hypothetical protein